jgi:hypothetical protein
MSTWGSQLWGSLLPGWNPSSPTNPGSSIVPFAEPIDYYLSLVTSEYQGPAPNMLAWLQVNLQLMADSAACLAEMLNAFNLNTAIGVQLDTIGVIVGQSRAVAFQPTGIGTVAVFAAGSSYVVGDIVTVVEGGASGGQLHITSIGAGGAVTGLAVIEQGNGYVAATGLMTTGGSGTGLEVYILTTVSPVLDDANYRILLQCRIAQNHWNGQIDGIQAFWSTVFPGGTIIIQDHQNMTATVYVSAAFNSILEDLIVNGYIVPRPEGVLFNFVLAELPVFGFDQNSNYVAGFDIGKFS